MTDVHHELRDERLLSLLSLMVERQNKASEKYRTAESPIAEQEQGKFHALAKVREELREVVESLAPECDQCGHDMELKRDERANSGWRWECRLHGSRVA